LAKPKRLWNAKTLHEARKYGFYWYDWLWGALRPLLIFGCALLVLAGGLYMGGQKLYQAFMMPVDASDDTPVKFVVASGSTLTGVSQALEDQGLIRNHSVLKYLMDFQGLSQKVQAGEYALSRSMSVTDIIKQLTQGDGKPLTRVITVIPGWTVETIAKQFAADGVIESEQEFLNACKDTEAYSDYVYIADVLATPKANQRFYVLEGYLAPDSYEVYTNASVDSIIRKLLSQTENVYTEAYHIRADELGMTMDQVMTLASMIEKEAKQDDFKKVSAIFHNRLKLNMTLGSDVTVQYSTRSEKMALTEKELSVISAYNTYTNTGLPVGPICNPSKSAIEAALYPDETFEAEGYLYFCSTDPSSGALYFSKTLEEHNAAVAKYRPLWVAYDESRGLN